MQKGRRGGPKAPTSALPVRHAPLPRPSWSCPITGKMPVPRFGADLKVSVTPTGVRTNCSPLFIGHHYQPINNPLDTRRPSAVIYAGGYFPCIDGCGTRLWIMTLIAPSPHAWRFRMPLRKKARAAREEARQLLENILWRGNPPQYPAKSGKVDENPSV